jgi:hypothetical protein
VTTTPIIPQYKGEGSFPTCHIVRLEDYPPSKPDPRQLPYNSIATPASPLAKFGTLASSHFFHALKAELLQPLIFSSTNKLNTNKKLVISFEKFQIADRSGCACNFNLEFVYIFSGLEGSAINSAMFNDACLTNLHILPGKYYLANAGFPSSLGTVIPY